MNIYLKMKFTLRSCMKMSNKSNNLVVRERACKEREKKVQILQHKFYCHLDKFIDLVETQHFLDYMHDVENNV